VLKTDGLGPLLEAQMSFRVAGARDCAPLTKCEGFVAIAKTMADVGHLKRIWKDAVRVAGAVQETCSSEILGSLAATCRNYNYTYNHNHNYVTLH